MFRSIRFWVAVAIGTSLIVLFVLATDLGEIADAFEAATYWYLAPPSSCSSLLLAPLLPLVGADAPRGRHQRAAPLLVFDHRLHGEQPPPRPRRRAHSRLRPWRTRARLHHGHPRRHRRRAPLRCCVLVLMLLTAGAVTASATAACRPSPSPLRRSSPSPSSSSTGSPCARSAPTGSPNSSLPRLPRRLAERLRPHVNSVIGALRSVHDWRSFLLVAFFSFLGLDRRGRRLRHRRPRLQY